MRFSGENLHWNFVYVASFTECIQHESQESGLDKCGINDTYIHVDGYIALFPTRGSLSWSMWGSLKLAPIIVNYNYKFWVQSVKMLTSMNMITVQDSYYQKYCKLWVMLCVSKHIAQSLAEACPRWRYLGPDTALLQCHLWWDHWVSWWTMACWGEHSREPLHQHTAAHPTGGRWAKNGRLMDPCYCQSHSSSHCQQRMGL